MRELAQDEEFDDREYPDEPTNEETDFETVACQNCGEEVYEDAEQCPKCREYLTTSTSVPPFWRSTSAMLLLFLALSFIFYILASHFGL